MSEKYKVTGMSCAACSARVERAVKGLDGVEGCSVNLLTGDMNVDGEVSRETVIAAVVKAGYGVEEAPVSRNNDENGKKSADFEHKALVVRLCVSLGLTLILMCFSMGHMVGVKLDGISPVLNAAVQMLLALSVMVINRKFFINGIKGVIHLAPNMDTLVSLGSFSSFAYSTAIFVRMTLESNNGADVTHLLHGLYFESAAMILALITLGKMLEARAKGRTTDAIRGLMDLSVKEAVILVDGEERRIDRELIKPGDIMVVRPGEAIPTDGSIVEGESLVDESMLTGESMPRDVFSGDKVYGGTLNHSGFIKVRAEQVGEETVLASIIKMVKDASSSKAPIAKMADKVSAIFVPAVLIISAVTFGGWLIAGKGIAYAIARGISVLVISCPCALGLATPVAIMVGSGVGAKRGILFKNATALEESGRVKTVVFDKTGTLTEGKSRVVDVISENEAEMLRVAYSLEAMSEHPLARAVVAYAEEKGLMKASVSDFAALGGRGVYGRIDGRECYGASIGYARELCELPQNIISESERLAGEGKTPIAFIRDGLCLGLVGIADTLRADAEDSIKILKKSGVRVIMLSGDNERTARAIAREVGIDEVIAGVLPEGKETVIREMMASGKVAMVGDGINDAPALTRADVGIAMGRGTDIAIDSADVVVMGHRVSDIPNALGIGRATLTNIKENLFWAFIYNSLGIPLAAGLFGLSLSPMIGAGMMSLSSFCVVMNALRLNLWKPKYNIEKDEIRKEIFTKNIDNNKENEKMTVTINVEGMMCPHCEARVKKACEAIDGVTLATPSHEKNVVVIECDKDVAEACKAAIIDAGYEVK